MSTELYELRVESDEYLKEHGHLIRSYSEFLTSKPRPAKDYNEEKDRFDILVPESNVGRNIFELDLTGIERALAVIYFAKDPNNLQFQRTRNPKYPNRCRQPLMYCIAYVASGFIKAQEKSDKPPSVNHVQGTAKLIRNLEENNNGSIKRFIDFLGMKFDTYIDWAKDGELKKILVPSEVANEEGNIKWCATPWRSANTRQTVEFYKNAMAEASTSQVPLNEETKRGYVEFLVQQKKDKAGKTQKVEDKSTSTVGSK